MTICYCQGMDAECPLCGGTGQRTGCLLCRGLRWVAKDDPEGIQRAYKAEPCKCAYKHKAIVQQAYGLTKEMQGWTFGKMVQTYPELNEIAAEIKRVLAEGRGWVVMSSHPGPGKSWLLASAVNESLALGKQAYYAQHTTLMTDFIDARMGRHREELAYYALMRRLTGVYCLALDEFGEGNLSEFQLAATRELLVSRSDTSGWYPTFIATNKEPAYFKRVMPWLHDRFFDDEVKRFTLGEVPSLRGRI